MSVLDKNEISFLDNITDKHEKQLSLGRPERLIEIYWLIQCLNKINIYYYYYICQ